MPYQTNCDRCRTEILYDVPDEVVCPRCGWEEEDTRRELLQSRCYLIGEDYDLLIEDFDDDLDTIEAYLWAMEKDD